MGVKALLTAIAIILGCNFTKAEEFRTWTEEASQRKIEAKILNKDELVGTVTLLLRNSKSVKLAVSRLVEEDQQYIKKWQIDVAPQDQLTVRVVKSGRTRGKRVEVDVQAGKTDVVVSGGCDAGCHKLEESVKAGDRGVFQIEVHDKYTFTLDDVDGNLIDKETTLKKTGTGGSR